MNLIDRAKNMLLASKTEWPKVNAETGSVGTLVPKYTVPLALVGSLGFLIAIGLLSKYGTFKAGLLTALLVFVIVVLTTVAAIYIADGIATSMGAQKNINKSAQWIVYGFTPLYIIFILGIIPSTDNTLLWIMIIVGFAASGFVLYQGAPLLKGTAADKTIAYTAAVVVISLILFIVLEKLGEKVLQKMLTPKLSDYQDRLEDAMRRYR
ncbi:MAG: hypothetical protein HOP10_04095 [Chitinophagaceae bacterium]|nr:hypothetical protein [Chitinophagaceae bacterium]